MVLKLEIFDTPFISPSLSFSRLRRPWRLITRTSRRERNRNNVSHGRIGAGEFNSGFVCIAREMEDTEMSRRKKDASRTQTAVGQQTVTLTFDNAGGLGLGLGRRFSRCLSLLRSTVEKWFSPFAAPKAKSTKIFFRPLKRYAFRLANVKRAASILLLFSADTLILQALYNIIQCIFTHNYFILYNII